MKGTGLRIALLLGAVSAAALLLGEYPAVAEDSPFGDAVQIADAQLDNLRGGFEDRGQVTARFGIDVSAWVNGKNVGEIQIGSSRSGHISSRGSTLTVNGGNGGHAVVQSGAQPPVTVVVPTTTLAVNSTVTSPATIISSI